MHVVIFAGGTLRTSPAVLEAMRTAELIIAADSGAATALAYGYTPAVILGDFDSLLATHLEEAKQMGSQIIRVSIHKDETDTELALIEARKRGASSITLLGALGGTRVDHMLANIFLLTGFIDIPIRILDGPATCWLLQGPGRSAIAGQIGDLLSLFPITAEVTGMYTTNLAYSLAGETLRMGTPRGISNELTQRQAQIAIASGILLIIHTAVESN